MRKKGQKVINNYKGGYNPNNFRRQKRGIGDIIFGISFILDYLIRVIIPFIFKWCITYPLLAVVLAVVIFGVSLKISSDVKSNSTEGRNKVLESQVSEFLLTDNGDGTKTTDFAEAMRLKLEQLDMQLEQDFRNAGLLTLYTDRMYEAKDEKPTYEEKPELYTRVQYQYTTKVKGTITASTHILPGINYYLDRKYCEKAIVGNSLYINIPDAAIRAEGFEDARGGSEAKDSFGAVISQIFNKKDEEESKAHDGMEAAIKKELDEYAQKSLLDAEVMEKAREAAVKELYALLGTFVDTTHIIIKANGAQLSDELEIINKNK